MAGTKYDALDIASKHHPEGNAADILHKRAAFDHHESSPQPFIRFVIIDVISDPATLSNEKMSHFEHDLGVSNAKALSVAPRNSIIARRVLGPNSGASGRVLVLYPFFPPHLAFPAKPGEHVWGMFENTDATSNEIGYWMCRIVQPNFVEDVNYSHADRQYDPSFVHTISKPDNAKYEFPNGETEEKDGDRYTKAGTASLPDDSHAYEKLLITSEASKQTKYEAVPRYRKRPADIALEGSNNALIVLGTDRTTAVSDYDLDPDQGKIPKPLAADVIGDGTGAIDLVAGRGQTKDTAGAVVVNKLGNKELGKSQKELVDKEGDIDFKNDRSRVLISQKTKPDKNFQIDGIVSVHAISPTVTDGDGEGSIVVKTDKLRLIARHDVVIIVTGASELDDNGNVKDPASDPDKCASVIIRTNGDIVFTPAKLGIMKLGGDDADLSPLCTRVNNKGAGGAVVSQPIIDLMGGAQGGADGINGTFPKKVLFK